MHSKKQISTRVIAFLLAMAVVFQGNIYTSGTITARAQGVEQQETVSGSDTVDESGEKAENADKTTTTGSVTTTETPATDTVPDKASTTEKVTTTEPVSTMQPATTTESASPVKKITVDTSKAKTVFEYKAAFTTEGLVVNAEHEDGTKSVLQPSDYTVEYASDKGFSEVTASMGRKKISVFYKPLSQTASSTEQKDSKIIGDVYTVQVVPAVPQKVIQYNAGLNNFSLSWDEVDGITGGKGGKDGAVPRSGYQVVAFDQAKNDWKIYVKGGPTDNKVENNNVQVNSTAKYPLTPGGEYEVRIRAFYKYGAGDQDVVYSDLSTSIKAVTLPSAPTQLSYDSSTTDSITVKWIGSEGADGYEVYRKMSGDSDYIFCNTTTDTQFTDTGLTAGKTYYYKVRAYNGSRDFCGTYTSVLKTSTLPAKTTLKIKGGDKRVRVNWQKVTGANGYKVYVKKTGEENYTETATVDSKKTAYTKTGLVNGVSYSVQVCAYRVVDNVNYIAPYTDAVSATTLKVTATSKKAKFYKNKKAFQKSVAYRSLAWFRKNVKYNKSFVMPGMVNTNVGGFSSYNMCPQAITFAGKYLLMTAYDRKGEENSVIYVMSKSTRKLVTTIILPDQYHVGGMAFDGSNVWLSHGNSVAAIKYSGISSAAAKKKKYANVNYVTVIKVQTAASYMTYYKGLLWIGLNKEQGSQPLYSYTIGSKSATPTLRVKDKKMLPNRVQGIAFLKDGSLVISRSNLFIKGQRFYIAQLETYRPTWSGKKIKALNKCKKVCPMPTMNEGIAANGQYLYVSYESPAFYSTTIPMDRICAFLQKSVKGK